MSDSAAAFDDLIQCTQVTGSNVAQTALIWLSRSTLGPRSREEDPSRFHDFEEYERLWVAGPLRAKRAATRPE
jgi:hypothetical protein